MIICCSYSRICLRFDPLVVPTLVDNLKRRVIVDSLNIMNYIDQVSGMHIIFLWFIYRKCRNHPFTLNPAETLL